MNKLVELNKKELTEINGGAILSTFPILRSFRLLKDVATIGWRFGKWMAE